MEEFKGELRVLQQLLKDCEASPEEVDDRKDKCEQAFHIFVGSHEEYMHYTTKTIFAGET